MKPIFPGSMPVPKGHYSPAMVHNGVVYVSGQLPIDNNGVALTGDFEQQAILCLRNMETILHAADSDLQHVLKVTVFVSDIANWPAFNEIYKQLMGNHKPARIVVPCNLLNYGCAIEIDCIAAVKEG